MLSKHILDYLKQQLLRNTSQTQLWMKLCKELEVTETPNWVDEQHAGWVHTAGFILYHLHETDFKKITFSLIEFLGFMT